MLEQQLVNGLMLGSVYALIAVAFTLAIGVLNFLNFSLPGLFMVAGMLTWYLLRAHIAWPIAALLAVALLDIVLKKTRTGRGLRTIAEDPETAVMLGVPVARVVPIVFIIGGL